MASQQNRRVYGHGQQQQHHHQNAWYAETYLPVQVGSIDGTDTVPHDRAVTRAEAATYVKPNASHGVTSDPLLTIFVARLNPETTEETFRAHFEKFGRVAEANIVRNLVTGESKRYGFVVFEDSRSCDECYRAFSGPSTPPSLNLEDRQLLVDYERSRVMKGWIPRRLGGGFGGKKDSGQLRFGARDRPFRQPFNGGPRHRDTPTDQQHPRKRATRDDAWRHYLLPKATPFSSSFSAESDRRRSESGSYAHHHHHQRSRSRSRSRRPPSSSSASAHRITHDAGEVDRPRSSRSGDGRDRAGDRTASRFSSSRQDHHRRPSLASDDRKGGSRRDDSSSGRRRERNGDDDDDHCFSRGRFRRVDDDDDDGKEEHHHRIGHRKDDPARDDDRRSACRDESRRSAHRDDNRRSAHRDESQRSAHRDDNRRSAHRDENQRSGPSNDHRRRPMDDPEKRRTTPSLRIDR